MDLGPLGLQMCFFVLGFGISTIGFGTIAVFECLVLVRCRAGPGPVLGARSSEGTGVTPSPKTIGRPKKPTRNPGARPRHTGFEKTKETMGKPWTLMEMQAAWRRSGQAPTSKTHENQRKTTRIF